MDFKVICSDTLAFYDPLDKVYGHYNEKDNRKEDQWISSEEAMHMLRTTNNTTVQKLRMREDSFLSFREDNGLHDRNTFFKYLTNNSSKT